MAGPGFCFSTLNTTVVTQPAQSGSDCQRENTVQLTLLDLHIAFIVRDEAEHSSRRPPGFVVSLSVRHCSVTKIEDVPPEIVDIAEKLNKSLTTDLSQSTSKLPL